MSAVSARIELSAFTDPCEASRMRGRCLSSDYGVLTPRMSALGH